MLKIFNDGGRIWAVELLKAKLIKSTVQFYDCTYEQTDLGQFVSSYYYLETLLNHEEGVGLRLDGGVEEWAISGRAMDRIILWLKAATE